MFHNVVSPNEAMLFNSFLFKITINMLPYFTSLLLTMTIKGSILA